MDANPQPPLEWSDWQGIRGALAFLTQQGLEMLGPPEAGIEEQVGSWHVSVTDDAVDC